MNENEAPGRPGPSTATSDTPMYGHSCPLLPASPETLALYLAGSMIPDTKASELQISRFPVSFF